MRIWLTGEGETQKREKSPKILNAYVLYSLWKSITPNSRPPVVIANKLFDALVKPIILYNCEIWGDEVPKTLKTDISNNNSNAQHFKLRC